MLAVLYYVRTRALHKHPPYVDLWEWMWWTGLITFSLLIVESLFVFDFFIVLADRDRRPGDAGLDPLPAVPADAPGARAALARRALLHKQKFADPEATIRRRGGRRRPSGAPQQRRR